MKKSSPFPDPSDLCDAAERRLSYLVVGNVRFSASCCFIVCVCRAALVPTLCSSSRVETTFSLCLLLEELDLELGGRLGGARD